jgi:hypothetical protein
MAMLKSSFVKLCDFIQIGFCGYYCPKSGLIQTVLTKLFGEQQPKIGKRTVCRGEVF